MVQQTTIDVIGVVLDVEPTQTLQLKDGTNRDKRAIVLGDQNDMSISATLWGETCDKH
jgi:ssDNA-binding replication factor A large subunit